MKFSCATAFGVFGLIWAGSSFCSDSKSSSSLKIAPRVEAQRVSNKIARKQQPVIQPQAKIQQRAPRAHIVSKIKNK